MTKKNKNHTRARDYERFIVRMLIVEIKQSSGYLAAGIVLCLGISALVGYFNGVPDAISAFFVALFLVSDIYFLFFSINATINGDAVGWAIDYIKERQFSEPTLKKFDKRGEITQATVGLGVVGAILLLGQLVSEVFSQLSETALQSRSFWTLVVITLSIAFVVLFNVVVGIVAGAIRHAVEECLDEGEIFPLAAEPAHVDTKLLEEDSINLDAVPTIPASVREVRNGSDE